MITWSEKIRLGMGLMKEGCLENRSGVNCEEKCPFRNFCWYCTDNEA
jgi:hypothetical protein